jgi:hypothetical protein
MAETAPEMSLMKLTAQRSAFEQLIRFQASLLIAQRVRDRFWFTLTSLGFGALIAAEVGNFMIHAGYLAYPVTAHANVMALSQAAILAILVLMTIVFLYGRLRFVRSEMDLLRLKLELISEDEGIAEPGGDAESATAALLRRRSDSKRAIDLGSDD